MAVPGPFVHVQHLTTGCVSTVSLAAPVHRSRERALRLLTSNAAEALDSWPSLLANLVAPFLAGPCALRSLGEVCRSLRLAMMASSSWRLVSLFAFAPDLLRRYSRASFTRETAMQLGGARRAWAALDARRARTGGRRGRTLGPGLSAGDVQRACTALGGALPPSLVAAMIVQWVPQPRAQYCTLAEDEPLEGSGDISLLPLSSEGSGELVGWRSDIVSMTLAARAAGSGPQLEEVNDIASVIVGTSPSPAGPTLWVGADGVFLHRPLSTHRVAPCFVAYLFSLLLE